LSKRKSKNEKNTPMIKKYGLTDEDLEIYELAQKWTELCEKYFPNYKHTKLKRGDPKKSIIFKICYKLKRETNGLIEKDEYHLYIRSQLEILKVQSKNNPLVLIDPMCLVGEKAWKRWKLWKKKYDSKIKAPLPTKIDKMVILKAIEGITRTKKFIEKNLGKKPSIEEYLKLRSSLINWINFGNISLYYVAVSPYMKKVFTTEDIKKLNFDLQFYHDCITEEVKKVFEDLFYYEI